MFSVSAVLRSPFGCRLKACAALLLLGFELRGDFQGSTHLVDLENGGIRYSQETSSGPIAQLAARLRGGSARLEWDERQGWLSALLKSLAITQHSQLLVFSKTSLQRDFIYPNNPRALYFNDTSYVGFIPGAPLIELSEVDSRLGAVFFTLNQTKSDHPVLKRVDSCLECHATARTLGVPGHLIRSLETDTQGVVNLATGIDPIDDRTPFAERWGGWYVSGQYGKMEHRGNRMGSDSFPAKLTLSLGGDRSSLGSSVLMDNYPSGGSDIVALMVFQHQVRLHNFITRLHYMAVQNLEAYHHIEYLKSPIESLVKALLFSGEAPLPAPIRGDPAFTAAFQAVGLRDRYGHSLRELDLERRLFRLPCSFLIHSAAFGALPPPLKKRIYERIKTILDAQESPEAFHHLSSLDRSALREMLSDTLPDLPEGWGQKPVTRSKSE